MNFRVDAVVKQMAYCYNISVAHRGVSSAYVSVDRLTEISTRRYKTFKSCNPRTPTAFRKALDVLE